MHAHSLFSGVVFALAAFVASSPLPIAELSPAVAQIETRNPKVIIEGDSLFETEERSSLAVLEERSSSYSG